MAGSPFVHLGAKITAAVERLRQDMQHYRAAGIGSLTSGVAITARCCEFPKVSLQQHLPRFALFPLEYLCCTHSAFFPLE